MAAWKTGGVGDGNHGTKYDEEEPASSRLEDRFDRLLRWSCQSLYGENPVWIGGRAMYTRTLRHHKWLNDQVTVHLQSRKRLRKHCHKIIKGPQVSLNVVVVKILEKFFINAIFSQLTVNLWRVNLLRSCTIVNFLYYSSAFSNHNWHAGDKKLNPKTKEKKRIALLTQLNYN